MNPQELRQLLGQLSLFITALKKSPILEIDSTVFNTFRNHIIDQLSNQDPNYMGGEGNTVRLHTYNDKSSFVLVKANKQPVTTSEGDDILVTEAIEVIPFYEQIDEGNLTKVVVWIDGQYYHGYLPTGALVPNDDEDVSNEHLLIAFLNDLEHGVHRVETRLSYARDHIFDGMIESTEDPELKKKYKEVYLKQHQDSFDRSYTSFIALKDRVKEDIANIRSGSLVVTREQLDSIKQQQIDSFDKRKEGYEKLGGTYNRLLESYDPIQTSGGEQEPKLKFSDVVEFVPLTKQWFEDNADINDGKGWSIGNDFELYWNKIDVKWTEVTGISGQAIDEGFPGFKEAQDGIESLQKHIDYLPEDFVKEWVKKADAKNKKSYVIIDSQTANTTIDAYYVSGISTKQQFGNITIHPIQTVITHESNIVGPTVYTQSDTHLESHEAKDAYIEANKDLNYIEEKERVSPTAIDDLYQSESYLELVNIAYILDEIKKL